jgi:hypothetical protein
MRRWVDGRAVRAGVTDNVTIDRKTSQALAAGKVAILSSLRLSEARL